MRLYSPLSKKKSTKEVREVLETVLRSWVVPVLDGVPVPGLKGVIATVSQIIQNINLAEVNVDTLVALTTRIKDFQDALREFYAIRKDPSREFYAIREDPSNFHAAIMSSLNVKLETMSEKLNIRHDGKRSRFKRFFNASKDMEDLKRVADELGAIIQGFTAQFLVELALSQSRVLKETERIQLQNRETEEAVFLGKLRYSVAASYNSLRDRDNSSGLCFEGTRKNILCKLKNWAYNPSSPPLLWLHGQAGIGKSTISNTFAKWLDDQKLLGANFVFQRTGNSDVKDAKHVFPTLAFHLAAFHPEIKAHIVAAIRDDMLIQDRELDSQFDNLILKPLRQLTNVAPDQQIFIVMDALDECELAESRASQIVSLFLEHQYCFPFRLRVFFTSRRESYIDKAFRVAPCTRHPTKPADSATALPRIVMIHPEVIDLYSNANRGEVQEDILKYLRSTLTDIWNNMNGTWMSQWPSEEVLQQLASRANDLFVYAATVTRVIGDIHLTDPKGQLKYLLSDNTALSGLDTLYLQIINKALPGNSHAVHVESFLQVLGVIVHLHRPISVSVLSKLLGHGAYDETTIRNILKGLHSVLIIPDTNSERTLRVYHSSFIDFIGNKERCTTTKGYIDYHVNELCLLRLCLLGRNSKIRMKPDNYNLDAYYGSDHKSKETFAPKSKPQKSFSTREESGSISSPSGLRPKEATSHDAIAMLADELAHDEDHDISGNHNEPGDYELYCEAAWQHHLKNAVFSNRRDRKNQLQGRRPGMILLAYVVYKAQNEVAKIDGNEGSYKTSLSLLPPKARSDPLNRFLLSVILHFSFPSIASHVRETAKTIWSMENNSFSMEALQELIFILIENFIEHWHPSALYNQSNQQAGDTTYSIDTYDDYLKFLEQIVLLVPRIEMSQKSKSSIIKHRPHNYYGGLFVSEAVMRAIKNQDFIKVVEYVESERVFLWPQALGRRSGSVDKRLDTLENKMSIVWSHFLDILNDFEQAKHSKISDSLACLGSQVLDAFDRSDLSVDTLQDGISNYHGEYEKHHCGPSKTTSIGWLQAYNENPIEQLLTLNMDYMQTLKRNQQKFSTSRLFPPQFSLLKDAAIACPVIILIPACSYEVSHIIIMTSDTTPFHIQVPELTERKINALYHDLIYLFTNNIGEHYDRISIEEKLRSALKILWTTVVKKIIDYLNPQKGSRTRVQWCPTGRFTFFPLHAAGIYDDRGKSEEYASQYLILSYTPTVGILNRDDHGSTSNLPADKESEKFEMMVVVDESSTTALDELEKIQQAVPQGCKLAALGQDDFEPTKVGKIMKQISTASVVHFACHNWYERKTPLESELRIGYHTLEFLQLMKMPISTGSLAFLTNYRTFDVEGAAEAMNLGERLLFCGFSNVVTTMWQIEKRHSPKIAYVFYKELFRRPDGQADFNQSALALDTAVQVLRHSGASLTEWVPIIHLGK